MISAVFGTWQDQPRCGCGRAERSRWQDPHVRTPARRTSCAAVVESSPSTRWKMSVARNVICWRQLTGSFPSDRPGCDHRKNTEETFRILSPVLPPDWGHVSLIYMFSCFDARCLCLLTADFCSDGPLFCMNVRHLEGPAITPNNNTMIVVSHSEEIRWGD